MLRDEIREYLQPDWLVTPKNEILGSESIDSTGNGLLYTSLYFLTLVDTEQATPKDRAKFDAIVKNCMAENGTLHRSKTKGDTEQTAHDDYIGVCAASVALQSTIAASLIARGEAPWFLFFRWLYKNHKPHEINVKSNDTWKAWLGRMPWNIAAMQFAACRMPNLLRRIALAFSIVFCGLNASSVIQAYLRFRCTQSKSFLINLASRVFFWRIDRHGGLKHFLAHELEPNHPIVRHFKEYRAYQ